MIPDQAIKMKAIYTRGEAAMLLGVCAKTIDRWCKDGKMGFGQDDAGNKFFIGRQIARRKEEITSGIRWYDPR